MRSPPPIFSWKSTRLKIALALLLGIYASVSMRSSLSMSIICMVNSTTVVKENDSNYSRASPSTDDGCPVRNEGNSLGGVSYEGDLLWSPSQQSTLFSATYYGSLTTMLIAGPMADKYGPKRILAAALSLFVVLSVAAPSLARLDYWTYYASRVVMGMGECFVMPSANALGARWFPANEKSTMAAIYTSGIQIAAASSNLIGSWLCGVRLLGGWPLIFYLFALIGACWLIIWMFFVTDHPSQNKMISEKEKAYLEKGVVRKSAEPVSIPWSALLTSREVYACRLCNFTTSFMVSVNQNFLPLYFNEELRLPLSTNGLFAITPFLTQFISKNIHAWIADHLKVSGKMSRTTVVKLFQAICSFGTFFSMLGMTLLPLCHRPWIAVVLLIVYGATFSGGTCGFLTSLLSIAPAYTGTLFSISMACGQLSSVLATYAVGTVTLLELRNKWLIIFGMGSVIQLFSGTFFLLYGSGEPATWSQMKSSEEEREPVTEILLKDWPKNATIKDVS